MKQPTAKPSVPPQFKAGRLWVDSLTIDCDKYKISGEIHKQLAAETHLIAEPVKQSKVLQEPNREVWTNFLGVSIGFLISVDGRSFEFITVPFKLAGRTLIGAADIGTSREAIFTRIHEGEKISGGRHQREKNAEYHTEQIFFEYLDKNIDSTIDDFLRRSSQHDTATIIIEKVVLDLHSRLPMCRSCEMSTLSMQKDSLPKAFLEKFRAKSIKCGSGFEVVTRMSNRDTPISYQELLAPKAKNIIVLSTRKTLTTPIIFMKTVNAQIPEAQVKEMCQSSFSSLTFLRSGDNREKIAVKGVQVKRDTVTAWFEEFAENRDENFRLARKKHVSKLVHADEITKYKKTDEDGFRSRTYLHKYAQDGDSQVVSLLADTSMDKNAGDEYGITPLQLAVLDNHGGGAQTIDALVASGADIHKGVADLTPLRMAVLAKNSATDYLLSEDDQNLLDELHKRLHTLAEKFMENCKFLIETIHPHINKIREAIKALEHYFNGTNNKLLRQAFAIEVSKFPEFRKYCQHFLSPTNYGYYADSNPYITTILVALTKRILKPPKTFSKDELTTEMQELHTKVNIYLDLLNTFMLEMHNRLCQSREITKEVDLIGRQISVANLQAESVFHPTNVIHHNTIAQLIRLGANPNDLSDKIVEAAGMREKYMKYWRFTGGQRPNFQEIHKQAVKKIEAFVRLGVSINSSPDGWNALCEAIFNRNADMVNALISLGADPNFPAYKTVEDALLKVDERRFLDFPLLYITKNVGEKIITALVLAGGLPSSLPADKIIGKCMVDKYVLIMKLLQKQVLPANMAFIKTYPGLDQEIKKLYELIFPDLQSDVEESVLIKRYQRCRHKLFQELDREVPRDEVQDCERIKKLAQANTGKIITKASTVKDYSDLEKFAQFQKLILSTTKREEILTLQFATRTKLSPAEKEKRAKLIKKATKIISGEGNIEVSSSHGSTTKKVTELSNEDKDRLAKEMLEFLDIDVPNKASDACYVKINQAYIKLQTELVRPGFKIFLDTDKISVQPSQRKQFTAPLVKPEASGVLSSSSSSSSYSASTSLSSSASSQEGQAFCASSSHPEPRTYTPSAAHTSHTQPYSSSSSLTTGQPTKRKNIEMEESVEQSLQKAAAESAKRAKCLKGQGMLI